MSAAALGVAGVMGETVAVNDIEVTGTVSEIEVESIRDGARGGRVTEPRFTIHLDVLQAARCSAAFGMKVRFGSHKGRVDSIADLGAGGMMLNIGAVNRAA